MSGNHNSKFIQTLSNDRFGRYLDVCSSDENCALELYSNSY